MSSLHDKTERGPGLATFLHCSSLMSFNNLEITVNSSTFLATYFINMQTSSTNDIILLCNTAFIGLVVVVPLQARGSWAGEIDPNLFPLQTQTASADLKGTRN